MRTLAIGLSLAEHTIKIEARVAESKNDLSEYLRWELRSGYFQQDKRQGIVPTPDRDRYNVGEIDPKAVVRSVLEALDEERQRITDLITAIEKEAP